ncbi:hypothetical protein SAMN05519104_6660 [Rhizobiales bacterium GAS188]|nr:hypothetical protein SAMN05519104_6660 [Rhizobiales bacterium GAS188]
MTQLHFRDIAARKVCEPLRLPPRRRRLSTFARHVDRSRPFILSVHRERDLVALDDQNVRLRSAWSSTLVGPRDAVLVTYLPRGGGSSTGGGGKATGAAIGLAVAAIALAVLAPYAIPAIVSGAAGLGVTIGATAAGAIYSIASAGIIAGASYLLSRASKPKANRTDNRPAYGITGGGNLPRPGDRIPRSYGRCWMEPDSTQPDFTTQSSDVFGDYQTLYKRVTLGAGKYQVHTIKVGDAVLWDETHGMRDPYSNGGAVEVIPPGGTTSIIPANVVSSDQVTGQLLSRPDQGTGWSGPFPVCPVGQTVTRIVNNWSLPQGCYGIYLAKGRNVAAPYGVEFQYAPIDDSDNVIGGWVDLPGGVVAALIQTTRVTRSTIVSDVPAGRYAVRARNTFNRALLFDGFGQQFVFNDATWDGLQVWSYDTILRPNVTEIAIKMKAGPTIGLSAIAGLMVDATAVIPVWDGFAWTDQPTQKAVWAYADLLRNSAYGAGLDDSRIDLARLLYYDGLGLTYPDFNGVIRGPVSVYEAGCTVLGPIQAQPVVIGGVWSMVRDEQHATKRHVITRRQIVRDTTSIVYDTSKDDGSADVIVEYDQAGDPRQRREVRATFGNVTLTPRRVRAEGIVDNGHAKFQATWIAACAFYRRRTRMLTTEHEGRMMIFGDPAAVDAWFVSKGAAAALQSVAGDGLTLTLDTDVSSVVALGTTVATFRDRTGREWGPVQVTQGASGAVVVMNSADVAAATTAAGFGFNAIQRDPTQEPLTVLLATLTEVSQRWIIRSVQPQNDNRIAIEAVEDNPGVWTALGQTIVTNPDIPSIPTSQPVTPVVPWVQAQCIQKATTVAMDWSVGVARGASVYLISISYDGGATFEVVSGDASTAGTYALKTVPGGTTVTVYAHAVGQSGVPGPVVQTTFLTFLPSIDNTIASLLVQIADLDAQVRRDIASVNAVGAGTLRDTVKLLSDQLQQLADATATEASNNYDQVTLLKAASGKSFAAIQTEQVARVTADTALASVSTALAARMTTAEGNISATSTALTSLTTRVTTAEGNISASASAITALQSTVNNPTTGVAASATAITSLNTSVSSINGTLSAQASSITALNTTVSGHTATLTTYGTSINGISVQYGITGTIDGVTGGFVFTGVRKLDGSVAYAVEIQGNLIVDGTITGTKLQANNIITASAQIGNLIVDTIHIKNNAITNSAGGASAGSTHDETIIVRAGDRVSIHASFDGHQAVTNSLNSYLLQIIDVAAGAVLKSVQVGEFASGTGSSTVKIWFPTSTVAFTTIGADGSKTYRAQVITTGGGAGLTDGVNLEVQALSK